MNKKLIATLILTATLGAGLFAKKILAAPPMIEVDWNANAQIGATVEYGACPCFRWTTRVQAAGGKIETKDFLISTDALFKFQEQFNPFFIRYSQRIYTVGDVEALWKKAHVGIGFDGVTFGEDKDLGYSDLLKTGLYALVNVLMTQGEQNPDPLHKKFVRLDLRTGFDYEQIRVNLGPMIQHNTVSEKAILHWETGRWSGNVQGLVSFDPQHTGASPELGASASVHLRMANIKQFALGLGLEVSADHDPFRTFLGYDPDQFTGSLFLDLSYVDGRTVGGK
jgi:hypothetical protein